MAPGIDDFFASYRAAFDRLDSDAIADHYAVPCLMCTNAGRVAWTDRAAIVANMRELCAAYRAAGYRAATYEIVAAIERGTEHLAVDLLWTVERAGGLPAWRFRTGYDLQRDDGAWRIVACVAYEESA